MATTTKSHLSVLSAQTATSFETRACDELSLHFQMFIDDVSRDGIMVNKETTRFAFDENISFFVREANFERNHYVLLSTESQIAAEWKVAARLQVTADNNNAETIQCVDLNVFEFSAHSREVSVLLAADNVHTVKFELRIVSKVFLPLPTFEDGNLFIHFVNDSNDASICVHRELLRLHSPYFAEHLNEGTTQLALKDVSKKDFLELLYQIYPTRRPLYANFSSLCNMGNKFLVKPLLYLLSRFLVDYNKKPMNFLDKLEAAINYRLFSAVREITYQAVMQGAWNKVEAEGFDMEGFCGSAAYKNAVLPAVEEASWKPFGTTSLGNPLGHPDFFSKMANEDSDNVALILLDVAFYVNRGVLSVHGTNKLQMDDRGQLHAVASDKFKALCTRFRLTPTQVLDSLLWSLYPLGMAVDAVSLRAAIVLCDDNGWQIAKDNLEQTFCAEPTSSLGQYYDQLKFAEEMKLENALNVAIMKAESSEFAIELVKLHQFAALSESTRNRIKQELLKRFANISAPSSLLDQVKKLSVGAQGYEELNEIATADDGESKQMFGQPGETHFIAA